MFIFIGADTIIDTGVYYIKFYLQIFYSSLFFYPILLCHFFIPILFSRLILCNNFNHSSYLRILSTFLNISQFLISLPITISCSPLNPHLIILICSPMSVFYTQQLYLRSFFFLQEVKIDKQEVYRIMDLFQKYFQGVHYLENFDIFI